MTKPKEPIRGVYLKKDYWYARVDGKEVYCGKGTKGHKMAVAAKAKEIKESYKRRSKQAQKRLEKGGFRAPGWEEEIRGF